LLAFVGALINSKYTSGLYYKHITIVNYDPSIVNKFGASLTDDTGVIIYDCHMFIVQATVVNVVTLFLFTLTFPTSKLECLSQPFHKFKPPHLLAFL
jgi:hypothetical protein